MKFSTIITLLFFVLIIFTNTDTFAVDSINPNEKVQTLEKEKGGGHITAIIAGRLEVSPSANRTAAPVPITVKVMRGLQVVAQDSSVDGNLSLNLDDLESGFYMVQIISSAGMQRVIINL